MSLLTIDGFDHYGTSELDLKGVQDGSGSIDTGGRCGTKCYHNASLGDGLRYGVTNTHELGQVGCAYNPGTAYPTSSTNIVQVGDADGNVLCFVSCETNGALKIWNGVNQILGTEIGATGAGVAVLNDFIYIEFRFRVNGSTGELRLFVGGTQLLSGTSLNVAGNPFGTVKFILNSDGCFDDVYIMNGAGTQNNASEALGDVHVATIYPVSDSSRGWTPSAGSQHSDLVDDPSIPDFDATYVRSETAGAVDSWNFTDLYRTSQVVYGAQTSIFARKEGIENRTIKAVVGSARGEEQAVSAENYVYQREMFDLDPTNSQPWTLSKVNSTVFGVELES